MGAIGTADGSALVTLGNTSVVCGIKAELANPPIEKPGQGWVVANVTIPAMCSPNIRSGPPTTEAQSLSQWMADLLQRQDVLDAKQLCLAEGKLAWVLYIDVHVMNNDGNLTDASMLAALASLKHLRLPQMSPIVENELPHVVEPRQIALELGAYPMTSTFGVWEGRQLADLSAEEEVLVGSSVSVAVTAGGDEDGAIFSVSKPSPSCRYMGRAGLPPHPAPPRTTPTRAHLAVPRRNLVCLLR